MSQISLVVSIRQTQQDVAGLDAVLLHKAENSALQAVSGHLFLTPNHSELYVYLSLSRLFSAPHQTSQRIEEALERHEKAITGLRLK